jgi:two-component system NtrC family sensor kinase
MLRSARMGQAISETKRPGIRGKLLIVDDEPYLADALARILASEHDSVAVTTAYDALALLAQGEEYDTILCDLRMPGMTGMDYYAQARRVSAEQAARIVFLTGATDARVRDFVETVPNVCLEKPVDIERLRAILRRQSGAVVVEDPEMAPPRPRAGGPS